MSSLTQGADVMGYGTHAARPAAGSVGRLYYETDTVTLFRDSGTAWVALPLGGTAPAMIKLGDVVVPGGGQPAIDFSSIDQSYRALQLVLSGTTDAAGTWDNVQMQCNSDATAGHYIAVWNHVKSTDSGDIYHYSSDPSLNIGNLTNTAEASPDLASSILLDIPGYASTALKKSMVSRCALLTVGNYQSLYGVQFWLNTAPVTDLHIFLASGNFAEHTTATLYGLT